MNSARSGSFVVARAPIRPPSPRSSASGGKILLLDLADTGSPRRTDASKSMRRQAGSLPSKRKQFCQAMGLQIHEVHAIDVQSLDSLTRSLTSPWIVPRE